MKKLLSTALALILATTMFTACAPSDNGTPDDATITRYTTEGKETKLVPDETATGELTISNTSSDFGGFTKGAMTIAIDKYKELYPNVKVNFDEQIYINSKDYGERAKKLQTEVMSGSGPDIFWALEGMGVFKMAKSGRIADMTAFFENDKNFNVSDYNETVLYSGQLDGKQYFLPSAYNVSALLTTQKNIDNGMININKMNNYMDMTTEILNIVNKSKLEDGKPYTLIGADFINWYIAIAGLEFVNYQSQTADVITEDMKNVLALGKQVDGIREPSYTVVAGGSDGEMPNRILYNRAIGRLLTNVDFYEALSDASFISYKEKPVIIPYNNIRGNQTAKVFYPIMVNDACDNKQNAYNFLKVVISPEVQGYTDSFLPFNVIRSDMIPISNIAVDMLIDSIKAAGAFELTNLGGLSDEFIDSYKAMIADIDSVAYLLPCDSIVREEIQRYYAGEVDIDTCLQSLQGKLEIYISE